ncbi:MAG: alpha-ketoacid dehydrogenase subunit beta [Elusimicrobia bacterium]|nr:alpha-ketoacid dehydrogenase subunit beta [Elusimicrobiota bacterium]
MRTLKYGEAIRAALAHAMRRDPDVFIMGLGVDDHKGIFGSTKGLAEEFGRERVFDTPISEGAMTGVAIGAALNGLKPVHVHMRVDFLYLAMDQLFNIAAKWHAMYGGRSSIPIVVRAVVGRSWGQGAQHSQCLPSFFMNVPGIKVAMPTTPADAQGLLLAAIADPNPAVLIEHRLLYDIAGPVPDPPEPVPFGKAAVRRPGRDLTIVANSHMAVESLRAAEFLSGHGIEAEVVDPVSLVPLDRRTLMESVRRTGRLLVVDTGWTVCGVSAEIAALAAEEAPAALKHPVRRLGMQPTTCPTSKPLENAFYPGASGIAREAFAMFGRGFPEGGVPEQTSAFKGAF